MAGVEPVDEVAYCLHMSSPHLSAALLAAMLLTSQTGRAADPAPAEAVTVTAERLSRGVLRAQASAFLRQSLADTRGGQNARWFTPVCAITMGVDDKSGAVFTARIADVARHVGLKLAAPGCDPNLAIVFTREARALVKQINRRQSGALDALPANERSLVKKSDLPVRWWHFTAPEAYDGRQLAPGALALGGSGVGAIGGDVTYNNNIRGSRIDLSTRVGITGAVIIVDITRLASVSVAALSDYIALVGLGRLRMDPHQRPTGSILAMFDKDAPRFDGMTDQDERFIEAMYGSNAALEGWRQRADMAGRMADAAVSPTSPPPVQTRAATPKQ